MPQARGPWDGPNCDCRNALLLFLDYGQHVLRFTTHVIQTQWTCPAPFSDPSPPLSPSPQVLLTMWASVLVVTRVCCDGRSQKWGWGEVEGRRLHSRFCLPSLFLQICSSGPHALASASHTHPTPVSPLPFHSHFLFHFCLRIFFFPMLGGGGLAGALGA